jgi:N-acetylmuramoyl-L-alanine amidase
MDLWVLSHIISAEAGDDNCPHDLRVAVGSVVLNRVASDEFPDSIREVVYQQGQYSPTWNGAIEREPSADSVAVAQMLLEEGTQIPADCVFQAEFVQGSGVYASYDTIYGTTYICYR